jgi:decaprenyl-phosphate phosphoribosyltransferase
MTTRQASAGLAGVGGVLLAALQAARPRQWPKNLLVFAAPLASASLGRDDGFGYALVAFGGFTAAASAVYLVNDVIDVGRDRRHPVKRSRPVASGRLPEPAALGLAATAVTAAMLLSLAFAGALLALVIGTYVTLSLLYSLGLKQVPVLELLLVASGFVLRALGGAVATHVPPSGWFLSVCSLGALMVAIGKRYTELSGLGRNAVAHRPVMRWYSQGKLRAGLRTAAVMMLGCYVLWALSQHGGWMRAWHLASALPLGLALARFGQLAGKADGRLVEDLIARDPMMLGCELSWLAMFTAGLLHDRSVRCGC